jgi:DNA repair ATPase RecN
MFDATKKKAFLEYIEFLSTFDLISNQNNLTDTIGKNPDLKNLIVGKLTKTLQEMKKLIDGLGDISTTRHFQNNFDELFEKLKSKFNFLDDVKINLNEYYPQNDILIIEALLKDRISVFFKVLDTNAIGGILDLLLNSYDENQDSIHYEQSIREYSNQVYNSYLAINSFKNTMNQIYLQFFRDEPNIEKVLKKKIFDKINDLSEIVRNDCIKLKNMSSDHENEKTQSPNIK